MMEVMMTAGAIRHAKLQSNIHHTKKPTPRYLQAGFPFCRPTNSVKALKDNCWVLSYVKCLQPTTVCDCSTKRLTFIDIDA